jgi:hypothetical protein
LRLRIYSLTLAHDGSGGFTLMVSWNYSILKVFSPLVVDIFKVECMNMTREIAQKCEENVDTQINAATRNQEYSEGRNEDLLR